MTEKIIEIDLPDPILLFGIKDVRLDQIVQYFPALKIVARNTSIKVMGEAVQINRFESKLLELVTYVKRFGELRANNVDDIIQNGLNFETLDVHKTPDTILHGINGLVIKAKTPNQKRMVAGLQKNDMLFALGPAGTGKTYTAVALAVKALKEKIVKRIVLTRPAVEAGENLGFLPGDLKEKLDPYMQPLYDALKDMIPYEKLQFYMETGIIEIAPLAFMRGRTLNNAFVILDEAQNTNEMQMKMFLTRMGQTAKFIITGDMSQIDLPKNQSSGLMKAVTLLQNVEGIDFVYFNAKDGLRHELVTKILNAYEK